MSNIANAIKDEVSRISRKEIRTQLAPLKAASANCRHEIAALKRRIAELERQSGTLRKQVHAPALKPAKDGKKRRFVAKGLPSLRKRLGLTVEDFAKVLGVSVQSIYNWQAGKSVPQRAQLEKLASVRELGKLEARALLSRKSEGN